MQNFQDIIVYYVNYNKELYNDLYYTNHGIMIPIFSVIANANPKIENKKQQPSNFASEIQSKATCWVKD